MEKFFIGLGVGLFFALAALVWQYSKRRILEKETKAEIERLKSTITDRMDIEADGVRKLKEQVEDLTKQNENLRITNAALMQKPDRADSQRLAVYQKAVDRLTINSPGFGPAWQSALKESEEEFSKIYSGTEAFWKKVLPRRTDAKLIEETAEDEPENN